MHTQTFGECFHSVNYVALGFIQATKCSPRTHDVIYLRNKETQQTLRVSVSIQYDASF